MLPAPMVMMASPARASCDEELDARLDAWEIVNVLVACFADGGGEGFASDAGDGRFAGGVNVGED